MYKFELGITPETSTEQILKDTVEAMLSTILYREDHEVLDHYLGELQDQGIQVNKQDE